MREMLRRFSAREYYILERQDYALRLISHPIDRYRDQASGVVDGAIFTYANGTNPEVLLVIDSQRQGTGPLVWVYAAAPLTRAATTLRIGDCHAAPGDVRRHPRRDLRCGGCLVLVTSVGELDNMAAHVEDFAIDVTTDCHLRDAACIAA